MRGKFYDCPYNQNIRFFKQYKKNNAYLVEEKFNGEKTTHHFFKFSIFKKKERIFDTTDNILQCILAIEKLLLKDKTLGFINVFLDEDETPFFSIFNDGGFFSVYNGSNDFILEYFHRDNECVFAKGEYNDNLISLAFHLYSLFKPGRSTLKSVEKLNVEPKKREFIHYSKIMESNFFKYKDSLDELLNYMNTYLTERKFPMNVEQIFFAKIRSDYTRGRFIRKNNTVKVDLMKIYSEKELYSILSHEFGHSFDHDLIAIDGMNDYISSIRNRLPKTSPYYKNYLCSDIEIIARTIQTDFLMYVFGENPFDNPNDYLNDTYDDKLKSVWFISSDELDEFHRLLNPSLLLQKH